MLLFLIITNFLLALANLVGYVVFGFGVPSLFVAGFNLAVGLFGVSSYQKGAR